VAFSLIDIWGLVLLHGKTRFQNPILDVNIGSKVIHIGFFPNITSHIGFCNMGYFDMLVILGGNPILVIVNIGYQAIWGI